MASTETTVRLNVASELLKLEAKLRAFNSARVAIADREAIESIRRARNSLVGHVDGKA